MRFLEHLLLTVPFSAPFGMFSEMGGIRRRRNHRIPKELENEIAGARTRDLRIKSPLLYQLSYNPLFKIDHAQCY